jgi:lipoprotein-anchoring transpeptidase ErfK/SrfK
MPVPTARITVGAVPATLRTGIAGVLLAALAACTASPAHTAGPSPVVALPPANSSGTVPSFPFTEGSATRTAGAPPITSPVVTNSASTLPSRPGSVPTLPSAVVTATPAFGSKNLSPVAPITISVAKGTLTALSVTNPDGKTITGTLSKDHSSWSTTEVLGYGKTYTVTGTAAGAGGQVAIKGSWTTVTPKEKATTSISPGDGDVVGIAQPVIVRLGGTPVDPTVVMAAMKITTIPHVDGAWAWVHHDGEDHPSLDWRPKDYWPAGTKVHVESNIYGLAFADGLYGGDDVTSDFTIGRAQVTYADARTFQIVVKQGCTTAGDPDSCTGTVATYPGSYGNGDEIGDPNRVTRSGIHVVVDKKPSTPMNNPAYGYTNSVEYWDVRISDNGEFIHENPNTVGDQGNSNVSHGCINLSPENAKAYYDSTLLGDPVEVTGTSVPLSKADGDLYDWTIPWSTWTTLTDPADA